MQSLYVNMPYDKLFNTPIFGANIPGYINKIEIKEIKKYKPPEIYKDKVEYAVKAEITPTSNATISKGMQTRFVILKNNHGIWKVAGDGTGP